MSCNIILVREGGRLIYSLIFESRTSLYSGWIIEINKSHLPILPLSRLYYVISGTVNSIPPV